MKFSDAYWAEASLEGLMQLVFKVDMGAWQVVLLRTVLYWQAQQTSTYLKRLRNEQTGAH